MVVLWKMLFTFLVARERLLLFNRCLMCIFATASDIGQFNILARKKNGGLDMAQHLLTASQYASYYCPYTCWR